MSPLTRLASFLTPISKRHHAHNLESDEDNQDHMTSHRGFVLPIDPPLPSLGLQLDLIADAAFPIPAQRPLSLEPFNKSGPDYRIGRVRVATQQVAADSLVPSSHKFVSAAVGPPAGSTSKPGAGRLDLPTGQSDPLTAGPMVHRVPLNTEPSASTSPRDRQGTGRRNSLNKLKEWANRSMPELSVVVGVKGYIEEDPLLSRPVRPLLGRRASTSRQLDAGETGDHALAAGLEIAHALTPKQPPLTALRSTSPVHNDSPLLPPPNLDCETSLVASAREREIRFGGGPMTYLYPEIRPELAAADLRPSASSVIRDTYRAQQMQREQRLEAERRLGSGAVDNAAAHPLGQGQEDGQVSFGDIRLQREEERSPDLSKDGRAQRRSRSFDAGLVLRLATHAPPGLCPPTPRHNDAYDDMTLASPEGDRPRRHGPHPGEVFHVVPGFTRRQSNRQRGPDPAVFLPAADVTKNDNFDSAQPGATWGPITLVTSFVTSPLLYVPPTADLSLQGHPFQTSTGLLPQQRLAVVRGQIAHHILAADTLLAAHARLHAQNDRSLSLLQVLPKATMPPVGSDDTGVVEKTQRILDHGVPMSHTLAIEELLAEWWSSQRETLNAHWQAVMAELDTLESAHDSLLAEVDHEQLNSIASAEQSWAEDAATVGLSTRVAKWARDAIHDTPVDKAYLTSLTAELEESRRVPPGSCSRFVSLTQSVIGTQSVYDIDFDMPSPDSSLGDRKGSGFRKVAGRRLHRSELDENRSTLIVLGGESGAISRPSNREIRRRKREEAKATKRREAFRQRRMAADPRKFDLDLVAQRYPYGDVPHLANSGNIVRRAVDRLLSRSSGGGSGGAESGSSGDSSIDRIRQRSARPRTPIGPQIMDMLQPRPRPHPQPQFDTLETQPRLMPFQEVDCVVNQDEDHRRFPWPCPGPVPQQHREVFSPAPTVSRRHPNTAGAVQTSGQLRDTLHPSRDEADRRQSGLNIVVEEGRTTYTAPSRSALAIHVQANPSLNERGRIRQAGGAVRGWRLDVRDIEGTDAWEAEAERSMSRSGRPSTAGRIGSAVAKRIGVRLDE